MAFYEQDLINEIISANEIVDVISAYVRLKPNGSNRFVGLCPFHSEKTPSFSVNKSSQLFYCFGCHKGGTVINFITDYENFTFPEAVEFLGNRAGIEMPVKNYSKEEMAKIDKSTTLYEINNEAAKYYYKLLKSDHGKNAYEYFLNRGLSEDIIKKFGLGYSDKYSDDLYKYLKEKGYSDENLRDSGLISLDERRGAYDKFFNRAMFPILNENSKVIAFGGRVMGEGEPKYLNSPETMIFNKSRTLYGLYLARRSRKNYFILCEGYMDVIACHQAGFDMAIASLGTAFTPTHASLIKRFRDTAYLCYDSDNAGINAALRAIPILNDVGISVKVIDLSPYKDPDEFIKALGADEMENRIKDALPSIMFRVSAIERNYNLSAPDEKTKFFEDVADVLARIPSELERDNYIESISAKYQVSVKNLQTLVNEKGTSMSAKGSDRDANTPPRKTRKQSAFEGVEKSQDLLIYWISNVPGLYQQISDVIGPDDFVDELHKKVARDVESQIAMSGTVNPQDILLKYPPDDASELARIFAQDPGKASSGDELSVAVKETIKKLLSVPAKSDDSDNLSQMSFEDIIKKNKKLKALDTLKIKI